MQPSKQSSISTISRLRGKASKEARRASERAEKASERHIKASKGHDRASKEGRARQEEPANMVLGLIFPIGMTIFCGWMVEASQPSSVTSG